MYTVVAVSISMNNLIVALLFALVLQATCDSGTASWSPLSSLADTVEYQPRPHQRRVSVPEILLTAATRAATQSRAQSQDVAKQPFARLLRQATNTSFISTLCVTFAQRGYSRLAILRRVQHSYRCLH
jgi:hypothetical protein